jgi:hypothetical protein
VAPVGVLDPEDAHEVNGVAGDPGFHRRRAAQQCERKERDE